MVRAPCFDKNGMKKGAWSDEEDGKLKAYIEKNGHRNWRQLPKLAGLSRCGKSCRLRWVNYLRPQVKRGNYTSEEEDLIINLHRNHGSRWSMIAAKLPGRSDNDIKNHWHTHLRKRTMNLEPKKEKSVKNLSRLNEKTEVDQMVLADVCSKSSSTNNKQTSLSAYNGAYYMASNWSLLSNNESFEDFWTKPFFPDSSSDEYLAVSTNLVEYVSLSDDHDSFMVDSYLWSVMDLYGW